MISAFNVRQNLQPGPYIPARPSLGAASQRAKPNLGASQPSGHGDQQAHDAEAFNWRYHLSEFCQAFAEAYG